jgi:hypothetical protein
MRPVNVAGSLFATATGNAHAIAGSATNGSGVSGSSSNSIGVVGSTSATNGGASGVSGFAPLNGVSGFASCNAGDACWGTRGFAGVFTASPDLGVGVEGTAAAGVGIRGSMLSCVSNGCTPTAGEAGQFVSGAGGVLLHGFLANSNGPGGWDEKFKVDTDGNLWTYGNAYKPGGGSWSTLSDARTKKGIEPIGSALPQLLKLRGVTYEYANPSVVHESPGTHIGMVAQEVEQVFPSWVDTGNDGYKRITFRGFEAVAVEAVRELDAKSNDASARIAELERQNVALRQALEELSEKVKTLQRK